MREITPLKFTSLVREQEIRGVCAVHGVPFTALEEAMNEGQVLVPPGSVDLATIEIGQQVFMENPSEGLEAACYAWLRGFTFAQQCQGTGKRLPKAGFDGAPCPLEELMAEMKRETWLQHVK